MKELDIITKLIRIASFGKQEDIPAGTNWQKVFIKAQANGVTAVCFEAIKTLPSSNKPDQSLFLKWEAAAQAICDESQKRHQAICELRSLLEEHGISMLLLKGEELSSQFPKPELWEYGDIEFVPCRDYQNCNALISSLGIEVVEQKTHSSFIYKGFLFKNYSLDSIKNSNKSHYHVFSLIKLCLFDLVDNEDGSKGIDTLTQAVHMVKAISELTRAHNGKPQLRMLLELVLLLKSHSFIAVTWENQLEYAGLKKDAYVLLCVSDILFGTEYKKSWWKTTRFRARLLVRKFQKNKAVFVNYTR